MKWHGKLLSHACIEHTQVPAEKLRRSIEKRQNPGNSGFLRSSEQQWNMAFQGLGKP
jgi:hypothetical protein